MPVSFCLRATGAVGDEVHELEVELAEDAVRLRQGTARREELAHLHRVLDLVQDLEDHDQGEAGEVDSSSGAKGV